VRGGPVLSPVLSPAEMLPLLREHLVDLLRDVRLPCAARVAATATTREDWADVLTEVQERRSPDLAAVARACTAMIDDEVAVAAEVLAEAAGLSLEQWIAASQADQTATAEESPLPPTSAAILADQLDQFRGDLRRTIELTLRSVPKPSGETARRYIEGDVRDIRHNGRMLERDLDRMQRLVAALWRANELAAMHDAQAARRGVTVSVKP
jgi:hypothetical protein